MKKISMFNTYPSFMLFMMSLCFGFLGLFMPWSSAYFRTLSVGASLHQLMGHPLYFWQSSFFALAFRQAPCRSSIISQANTPQGHILSSVQTAGFLVTAVLIILWLVFLWTNRKALTESQKSFLLKISMILFVIGALFIVRMLTFPDCSLIETIELLDVNVLWPVLIFPVFAIVYGILAIIKGNLQRNGV